MTNARFCTLHTHVYGPSCKRCIKTVVSKFIDHSKSHVLIISGIAIRVKTAILKLY